MTAQILDGKALAKTMSRELAEQVAAFEQAHGWAPGIAVVQVGADPASSWYVKQINKSFTGVGMRFALHTLEADAQADALTGLIQQLNADPQTNGIIVQMPLPKHLPQSLVTDTLDPRKDVDGIHPIQRGAFARNRAARAWRRPRRWVASSCCGGQGCPSSVNTPLWWGAATLWAVPWRC
jgi:methylenetetrahydrofolate dehydrogenase (NADP+)/methenyltetrahydrofolate cyclohydrolase